MSEGELLAIDLVAVLILAFGLYFPRYQRRDMVVALLGINIGVMAVATALANAEVTAGVGLGLFGVLSIIRIRSEELTQPEVVFYFAAIAMGVLSQPAPLADGDIDGGGLMTMIIVGIAAALAAPIGDLAESQIKRDLGIKDMGTILPGHGGLLDRFDGLLFVLPTVWYVANAFIFS